MDRRQPRRSRHPLHPSNYTRTRWPEYIPLIILCVHSECELSINHRRREKGGGHRLATAGAILIQTGRSICIPLGPRDH